MAEESAPERIVVGVDGSDSSKSALRWAAAQALATGSQLWAVQASWSPVTHGAPMAFPDVDFMELAREDLQGIVADVLGPNPSVPVVTRALEGPLPWCCSMSPATPIYWLSEAAVVALSRECCWAR